MNHCRKDSETDGQAGGVSACFVAAWVVYVLVFYAAVPERWQSLWAVFVPDDLVLSWMGGDVRQFTVLDRIPVLLVAAAILMLALALGWLTMLVTGLCTLGPVGWVSDPTRRPGSMLVTGPCTLAPPGRGLTRLEVFVFSVGVGLSQLSLLTLAVGLIGGLRTVWPWLLPLLIIAGLGVWSWRRGILPGATRTAPSALLVGRPSKADRDGLGRPSYLWLAVPFVLVTLLGSMLPPVDFDVREYHLQVPKEWYQHGRIDFLPHNVYGNMPLGAEMHALLAMTMMPGPRDWWWGALAGKTVIACFAPLGALGLLAAGRRLGSPRAGGIAALVYVSLPWIVHVSVTGLIEGAVAFYTLLTVYALCLATMTGATCNRGLLALAGFLAGSAAACKYPAIVLVVFPLAVWATVVVRPPRWRAAAAFLLAAACGCGLWLGKNWVLAENPVYPLLFGGKTRTEARIAQWNRAHRVPVDEHGNRYSARQLGQAVAQFGWESVGQSPILLPFVATAFLRRGRRRWVGILALYAAFYLAAWWFLTHRVDRFWVPVLPVLSLLAGIGADWSASRTWRGVVMGTVLAGLAANLLFVVASNQHDCRYFVSLEQLRRDEPAEPDVRSRVDAAHRYLNDAVQRGHCVLLVGDAQPFDLEVPVLYNTCFDACILEELLRGRTREERLAELNAARISHVLVNWSEIDRYRSPGNYGFTDFVTRDLVHEELVRQQGLLHRVDLGTAPERAEVFEVVPSHSAGPSPTR